MAAGQSLSQPAHARSHRTIYVFLAWILLLQCAFTGLQRRSVPPRKQQQQQAAATLSELYFKPMADLVEPHGYTLEEHFVTTPDGYILRLFRIPPRKSSACSCSRAQGSILSSSSSSSSSCDTFTSMRHGHIHLQRSCQVATGSTSRTCTCSHSTSHNSTTSSPVVFMQHALMDSSAGWLLLGPKRALALQLADAGFDVWLGNSRGNRYSRNHTRLSPDEPAAGTKFWAYSWDDLAQYDLPASIEYSMQVSQQPSLVYIGYSQGTMIGLAALASQPKLAASISLAILIAPVAFTTAMTSPAFVLSSKLGFDNFALQQGWGEWGSFQQGNSAVMQPVCRRFPGFCLSYLTAFCGTNPHGNVEDVLVPKIFQHLPAGTSVKVMAQWGQSIRRGSTTHLHRFDYGSDCAPKNDSTGVANDARLCNQQAYGQADPPVYDLGAITTPLALFTGGQDTISSSADVELLKGVLQPGVLQLHHHQPNYAHLDFELGTDAPDLAYPELLRFAVKYGFKQSGGSV